MIEPNKSYTYHTTLKIGYQLFKAKIGQRQKCCCQVHAKQQIKTQGCYTQKMAIIENMVAMQKFSNSGGNQITALGIKQLVPMKLLQLQQLGLSNQSDNSGNNSIGSKGSKLLAKMQLPHLQIFWLCECRLGNEGVRHLNKGKWSQLKQLGVSKYMFTSVIMISSWMAIQQLVKATGNTYQNYIYKIITNKHNNLQMIQLQC